MSRSQLATLLSRVPQHAPYRKYLVASYAENTRRAYAGDVAHFRKWGGRVPATEMQLARYLADHAGKQAFATLSRRIAGIHREHMARGLRSPARGELVRATLRGIARTYSRKQRQMRPLLRAHLLKMLPQLRGARGARDKALLLMGFLGGFRRSEIVALDLADVRVSAAAVSITVRKSKTDQEGAGRVVKLPRLRGPLCPYRALMRWLRFRPSTAVPLFTKLAPTGSVTAKRLNGGSIAIIVKQRIAQIGLEPAGYSGHSLRAGFVTSAAVAGAPTWQIKQQTGHKTDAVVAGYIRDGSAAGVALARRIAAA